MALTDQASYTATCTDWLAHWAQLEATSAGAGLVLPGNVDYLGGKALFERLRTRVAGLPHLENERIIAGAQADFDREAVMGRMREFGGMLRVYWQGLPVVEALPSLPGATASLDHVLRAARRVLRLWQVVNEGPAPAGVALPLVLPLNGGVGRAEFLALYAALPLAQEAVEAADVDLTLARVERVGLEGALRQALAQYRALVPLHIGRRALLAQSLPRLTPLPGHTPERPVVEAAVVEEVFRLSWEPLEEPTLKCWQVRVCRSARYNKARERVLATIAPEGPRVWEMARALARGGIFRVYAVLTTGNERGSQSQRMAE